MQLARNCALEIIVCAVCLLSGFSQLFADEWPQFRGPTSDGIATEMDLPVHWDQQRNVRWKRAIRGTAWSSPIVVGNRVFLTTAIAADSNDVTLTVLCVAADSGRILWETGVFRQDAEKAPRIHNKNSHASPSSVISDGKLYVHFGHQGTACLDLDGNVIWKSQELSYQPVHGNGGSPVVVGDALIFTCDGGGEPFVAALNKYDGSVTWRFARPVPAAKSFSFCTPLVIDVDGAEQAVAPGSNSVSSLDPSTGREIWRVEYDGYSVVPRPVYAHGLVFVCTGYDEPELLAIRADGEGDVTETHVVWRTDRAVPLTPSPLLAGDNLFLLSDRGVASYLDAKTGKLIWRERIDGSFSASPIWSNGLLYVQSEDGTGIVLKASQEFQKVAENPLGERSLASYAVEDDALFIRTADHLYRIESLE